MLCEEWFFFFLIPYCDAKLYNIFFRTRVLEQDAGKSDSISGPPIGFLDNSGELFFLLTQFLYHNEYFV